VQKLGFITTYYDNYNPYDIISEMVTNYKYDKTFYVRYH